MATNEERADAALMGLEEYAYEFGPPLDCEDNVKNAIADLIGNLGHDADRRKLDFLDLVRRGVGMWSAERRAPLVPNVGHEPGINDIVTITVIEQPAPTQSEVDAEC